jgi:hypothetical protein
MSRFPVVFGDNNNWGTILNDLLAVCLAADGTLNADVVGALALAPGAVTNTEVNAAAAIARSKLNFGSGLVNADIAAAAAIARSKLDFGSGLVNADIAAAAAIAASKLAAYPSDSTKFLAGDGTWKAAGGTVYRKTTAKTVSNTVAETDLLNGEITVAANAMGASSMLRATLFLDILTNNSGNFRFKLKLGATTLIDTGANFAPTNNASRTWLEVGFEILNLGATNSQQARMRVWMPQALDTFGPTTGTGSGGSGAVYHFGGLGTGAVDTTSAQALALTVQHNAASVNQDAKLYGAVIEII